MIKAEEIVEALVNLSKCHLEEYGERFECIHYDVCLHTEDSCKECWKNWLENESE